MGILLLPSNSGKIKKNPIKKKHKVSILDIILQNRIEATLGDLEIKREQFQKLKYEFSIAYEKILQEEFYKKRKKKKIWW